MPPSSSNIRIQGGTFRNIKGDFTLVDRSRHQTNIGSNNICGNKLTDAYNNNNFEEIGAREDDDGQRREDRPPPSQAKSHQINRDCFNIKNNQIDNAYNDRHETHYVGRAPPTGTGTNERVRPQKQSPKLPADMGNTVLPQKIQHIGQSMYQTFSKTSTGGSLSKENDCVSNMPRNNDDDEEELDESGDRSKPPPPLSISSGGPIYTTYEGNLTKIDNSVHKTNISAFNVEDNLIKNSFNKSGNSLREPATDLK